MQNYRQEGDIVQLTAPSGGKSSGDVVKVGNLIGVVVADAAEGAPMQVSLKGVFNLTKETADDVSEGEPLYWKTSSSKVTVDPDGNEFIGYAVEAAAATTDTDVEVLLVRRGQNQAENIAAEATANGSDAATTQALANALKTKMNAVLAALKEAGLMEADA